MATGASPPPCGEGLGVGLMSGITPHIRLRARELRLAMTPQERKLWGKLREVNGMLDAFSQAGTGGAIYCGFRGFWSKAGDRS